MVNIKQIIGKVNPILYASNGNELLKKYKTIENIPADEIKSKSLEEHSIVYDSPTETLEPIYFFILDMLNDFGLSPEKLIDNFSSTPGSGHFAELGQRATIMQQNATRILGDVNTVLRSVLNLIYDLKEFRTRLQSYSDLKSKDKNESAMLSLKQIWLDRVDVNKGNTSVKAMAFGQSGFQTLIHAFMAAKDEKDVDKLDLNDMVKRILKPRIHEFNIWLRESEGELRKRYELEKSYLRSQVNSLKLYSRWVKPYLNAAQQLEMTHKDREPALVNVFNTLLLQLTLLGKTKTDVRTAALEERLPSDFEKLKIKRDYFSCILVDFKFRGIPQRAQQQHFVFGGRAEITFSAYALNSDELDRINKELENSDVNDVLKLMEGATTESLEQMQDEINFFLEEKTLEEKSLRQNDESNPFIALIGGYNKDKKPKAEKSSSDKNNGLIRKDDWIEKTHIRELATENAKNIVFALFDVYKKAHGMASYT